MPESGLKKSWWRMKRLAGYLRRELGDEVEVSVEAELPGVAIVMQAHAEESAGASVAGLVKRAM